MAAAFMSETYTSMSTYYTSVDAIIKPAVFSLLDGVGLHLEPSCHLTSHLPLVSSPTPVILSVAAYLVIVSLGVLLSSSKNSTTSSSSPSPSSQTKRKDPYWLAVVVLFHNVFLVALSLYMCVRITYEALVVNKYNVWGNAFKGEESERMLAHTIWIFYVSKLYEFMDTFIMLLKGNLRQVSFLHVYHHGTISFIWWAITFHAPGGDAYFSAALNSWVHVLMYAYYFLAATLPKEPSVRSRYLWWGKYLTLFQMSQFAANFVQGIYAYATGSYHSGISALLVGYMVSLLFLFGNFFVQKHFAGGKKKKSA
ncbi:elongation of very long chain fatty acids protein [Pycnococcus provasolii]